MKTMTTEPKPQRSAGLLIADGFNIIYLPTQIRGKPLCDLPILAVVESRGVIPDDDDEAEANAAHLAACWNACERANINPAAVEELVAVVERAAHEHADGCRKGRSYDRQWTCLCDRARAALANTRKVGP